MNSIKTNLLLLFLLFLFNASAFAQSDSNNVDHKEYNQQNLETDSVLNNCYFTEKEYNRIHKLKTCGRVDDSEYMYEDEIYTGKKHKKRGRDTFLDDVPVDLVVDVVLNTLFFVAILWQ